MAAKRKGASSKKKASRKKSRAKKGRAKKGAARKSTRKAASGKKTATALGGGGEDGDRSLLTVLGDLAGDFAGDVTGEISRRMRQLQFEAGVMLPLRASKALLLAPANPLMAQQAGAYLREVRELAGLTVHDVGEAVEVADESILEAVENGTAAVSFELLLRLAAILARHDPVPVVLKFMRTYNPEVFSMLESWGVGRLPLQYEREREFVNIFRRHDAARELSDDGFERVLDFTRAAFEMSLHFVAAEEDVVDEEHEVEDE